MFVTAHAGTAFLVAGCHDDDDVTTYYCFDFATRNVCAAELCKFTGTSGESRR